MKAPASFICAFTVLFSSYSNAQTVPSPSLSSQMAEDLPYRAALFHYNTGNYLKGLMGLSFAKRNVETRIYREILSGKLNLELKRYQAAQEAFDALTGSEEVPGELVVQAAFPLAKLNYVKHNCANVLAALEGIRDLPVELDNHARFMSVSCLVQQPGEELLRKGEKIILEAVSKRKEKYDADIWFAYAYYNLAISAVNQSLYSEADRYFREALKYTGASVEGEGLANRIRLSLAYTNYASNRYAFAMNSFSELPLDSLWADKNLLGYGWSAFNNFKPGIALEAWRQLVNLPFKSMSVYEGYIAIPYALEKSRSYSEAWEAYKTAISEYTNALSDIDKLASSLTLARINAHAEEYALRQGELIEPLHPLLAYTYAQDDFRSLIEQVGEVKAYEKRLDYYVDTLNILSESRTREKNSKRMSDTELKRRQSSIEEALGRLNREIPLLADKLLENEMKRPEVEKELAVRYQEYLRLKQAASSSSSDPKNKKELNERLERLKGVLIGQLYGQSRDEFGYLASVTELTGTYNQLAVRYASYQNMRKADYKPLITDKDLRTANIKITELKKRCDQVVLAVQKQLHAKTLLALEEQKKRIVDYRFQARVAKTRLEEEFFKRGSQGL